MQYLALATDYDGTLAHHGLVAAETLQALARLRKSGRKVFLVTGREVPELKALLPDLRIFDAIVAENGALVYWPADGREDILAEPPPTRFLEAIQAAHVEPYSQGRVIFATWVPHEKTVLEVIQQLGLEFQIIFNKGAVMVLPSGVNKATGLARLLERLEMGFERVVGIGDAENDHAFLDACGVAVAVSNALSSLKQNCDLVTEGDHGRGVEQLIDRLLADDLSSLGPRRPRKKMAVRTVKE